MRESPPVGGERWADLVQAIAVRTDDPVRVLTLPTEVDVALSA